MPDSDDAAAKAALHDELRWARAAVLGKLEGLGEYDARRPLTASGTNLLGLVKHLAMGESMYLGEVFGRPFPDRLPWWDTGAETNVDQWVAADESRDWVLDLHARACAHADATVDALPLGAPGRVPWWPQPEVRLVNVLAHLIAETNRHAGHADILREQLDGSTGDGPPKDSRERDVARRDHVARVDAAAHAAARSS